MESSKNRTILRNAIEYIQEITNYPIEKIEELIGAKKGLYELLEYNEMEILEEIEIIKKDRYQIRKNDSYGSFMDDIGLAYVDDFKVFFNLNNSGQRDFDNFLYADSIDFQEIKDIEDKAKELNLPLWKVVSFYRENGYDGVYSRTGNDALSVKCNNWVNQGRDGFMYVIFSDNQELLDDFTSALQQFINEGSYVYEVYNQKEGEFLEAFNELGSTYEEFKEWKEEMKKIYGFQEEDFNVYE